MKSLPLIIIILSLPIALCACIVGNIPKPPPPSELSLSKSGEGRPAASIQHVDFQKPFRFEPMPPEILSDIRSHTASKWTFSFRTYDHSQPPKPMGAVTTYRVDSDTTEGHGLLADGSGQSFSYRFPSSQPFWDLVDYMESHPNVFFDHSEFAGAEPGKFLSPENAGECFEFWVQHYDSVSDRAFGIAKGPGYGQQSVAETEYVIDELRDLRDELLQHPVERGQGQ
jgi:hypothetical protein